MALNWPRPDFQLAGLEFLIGLFATALPPADQAAWCQSYRNPPGTAELAARFAPFHRAFMLDGDGPRFMQDFEDFEAEPNDLAGLLIEAPGENTIKRNADLMIRRGRVNQMGRAAAAMALFTLQNYAPAGGAGNRTSLRGGGPLTTLALPPHARTLWHVLWANVPCGAVPPESDWPRVFPWLAPTRLSDKTGRPVSMSEYPPALVWWATPRRIRLDFAASGEDAHCDITGQDDGVVVRSWRQRPWGAQYQQFLHPLSPYYLVSATREWLPLHPQPGGVGYQQWLGVLLRDKVGDKKMAAAIATYRTDRHIDIDTDGTPWRLLAGGFDMDNMKARGFVESEMPVWEPQLDKLNPGEEIGDVQLAHDGALARLIKGADAVSKLLGRAVKGALYGKGEVKFDSTPLATLRERFWSDTQNEFYRIARESLANPNGETLPRRWLKFIATTAMKLFHEFAPMDASGEGHPDRIAREGRQLSLSLAGRSKDGEALFTTLALATPEKTATAKKGKRA